VYVILLAPIKEVNIDVRAVAVEEEEARISAITSLLLYIAIK
jgi:hypothetical protein